MKTIVVLPMIAAGLAACAPMSNGRGPVPPPAPYRALGTEPFWDLIIAGGGIMAFTDRGTNASVTDPTPPARIGLAGATFVGRRLTVSVIHAACSDGMSDRRYPDTVTVSVDGRAYRGCGGAPTFFAGGADHSGSDGQATRLLHAALQGRWTAIAIDGRRAAPRERFFLVMTPDEVRTENVCNDLRGRYVIVGGRLVPDGPPWPRSERGCAPGRMQVEDRVYAALGHNPTITFIGNDHLRFVSPRGTIELARAR